MFVNKNGLISMKLEMNNDFVILFNFLPQHLETHNVLIVLYVLYTVLYTVDFYFGSAQNIKKG